MDLVPEDAGAQVPVERRSVTPAEHFEHPLEQGSRERLVGRRPPDEVVELIDVPVLHGHHGHDLLRQHIQGILGRVRRFYFPSQDALGHHRRLDDVFRLEGQDPSLAGHSHEMTGTPDPLQPPGDRLRGLDLDYQIDRADVDAQLERGGADDRFEFALLQGVLHLQSFFASDAAVMDAHDPPFVAGPGCEIAQSLGHTVLDDGLGAGIGTGEHFVQPVGHPLGGSAIVGEDESGPVFSNQLADPLEDRNPYAPGGFPVGGKQSLHAQVHRLLVACVYNRDWARFELRRGPSVYQFVTAEKMRHVLEGPDGGGEAKPLHGAARQALEPFQAERQVHPPFVARQRVDFVHDDGADGGKEFGRTGICEHDVQGFGRGDQNVWGVREKPATLGLRCVAGTNGHPGSWKLHAEFFRRFPDAPQRFPQISLDVVVERLQGRYVDQTELVEPPLTQLLKDPIDAPEESGQRLARAGRREDEGVLAPLDRRPALGLGCSWLAETFAKPDPCGFGEALQRIRWRGHGTHLVSDSPLSIYCAHFNWSIVSRGCRLRVSRDSRAGVACGGRTAWASEGRSVRPSGGSPYRGKGDPVLHGAGEGTEGGPNRRVAVRGG